MTCAYLMVTRKRLRRDRASSPKGVVVILWSSDVTRRAAAALVNLWVHPVALCSETGEGVISKYYDRGSHRNRCRVEDPSLASFAARCLFYVSARELQRVRCNRGVIELVLRSELARLYTAARFSIFESVRNKIKKTRIFPSSTINTNR